MQRQFEGIHFNYYHHYCGLCFSFSAIENDCSRLDDDSHMKAAMASCHSLTYIEGEISGDPLDVKMFESTGM